MNIHYTSSVSSAQVPTAAQLYGGVFHAALIVADDAACADRMRRILCELAPHRRVVVASGRAEAFNLLAALPYDLVLVDMRLQGNDGAAVLHHVRQTYPRIECIGMSATDDQQLVNAAIAAGAIGYLLTETDDAELAYLLRSIERGGSPMDSRIARRILGSIAASAKARTIDPIRVQKPAPQRHDRPQDLQQAEAAAHLGRTVADVPVLAVRSVVLTLVALTLVALNVLMVPFDAVRLVVLTFAGYR